MARPKVQKDPNVISRNVFVHKDDISTIAVFALTTKNISFKKYAEQLLAEKASLIRKKIKQ